MKESIRILTHCKFEIIGKGIERNLEKLSFDVKNVYDDLYAPGLLKKVRTEKYDFFMVLPLESDEDFLLCLKLKTFIPDIPLIFIASDIPEGYRNFLHSVGVEIIMELPVNVKLLEQEMSALLQKKRQ